jgi:hypothetical protein
MRKNALGVMNVVFRVLMPKKLPSFQKTYT